MDASGNLAAHLLSLQRTLVTRWRLGGAGYEPTLLYEVLDIMRARANRILCGASSAEP